MQFVVKNGIVVNEKGEVGVLYSKAYHHRWNNVVDKRFAKAVMFYAPLVLFLATGGNPQELVNNQTYKLTEKGSELTHILYTETTKQSLWLEDLKYLNIKWVPQGKKIRVIVQDGYEQIEVYDEIFWIDIPSFESE